MLDILKQENIDKECKLTMPNGAVGTVKLKKIEPEDIHLENVEGFEDLECKHHLQAKLIRPGFEKCFYLRIDWFQAGLCKLELL